MKKQKDGKNDKTMNEFEVFGQKKEIEQITLPDAKAVLERGLKYFVGEHYQWLPEYDEVCRWLADNKRRGLMLFGSNGRGKTQICHNIMPVLFKHYFHRDYLCVEAKNLSQYNRSEIDKCTLWYATTPIIIDDVGVESIANDYGEKRDLFSEIVDQCEKKKRLLILTTNLTPDEICERYGLRTLDRLKVIVKAIKFKGDSLRDWSLEEK